MRGCCSDTRAYPNITAGVRRGWIAGVVVGIVWAGFCCWLLCLPDAVAASLPMALKVFVSSVGSLGSVLAVSVAAFLVFGGLAMLRPAVPSRKRATTSAIILSLLLMGVLSTGYLGWARYRISDCVIVNDGENMPRPWPYPDRWLLDLHDWLDVRNPVPPDIIKWHGELDRLQLILDFAVAASALLSSACLMPFVIPRRQRLRTSGARMRAA